jgi:ABC-2 type transport system ATP-binding protein
VNPAPSGAAGADAVLVRDLRKSYGAARAVNGISFTIRQGEVFGLLGPHGAGKTTTVEILEGLRRPDGGQVMVCGFDPTREAAKVRERIGVSLQATALPDKIRVREALNLFAGFFPRRADLGQVLALAGLEETAQSAFDTLSGGQKQRVAVALALVNDPVLVILDEPTAGLDPQARRELHGLIGRLREQGKTVILTTHYLEEAEQLCDRVAIMDRGAIIALDRPGRIVAQSGRRSRIEFSTARPIAPATLRQLPFTESVAQHNGANVLRVVDAQRTIIELIKWLEAGNHELLDLHVTRPTLEDIFLELTGRRGQE